MQGFFSISFLAVVQAFVCVYVRRHGSAHDGSTQVTSRLLIYGCLSPEVDPSSRVPPLPMMPVKPHIELHDCLAGQGVIRGNRTCRICVKKHLNF